MEKMEKNCRKKSAHTWIWTHDSSRMPRFVDGLIHSADEDTNKQPRSSVVTKKLDVAKTEAAGFETEAKAVYLETKAKTQVSWSIFFSYLSFPTTSK